MRRIEHTKKGVLDGRSLVLYPDGEVAAILYYRNGELEGQQAWFYPNKYVKRIRHMEKGVGQGRGYEFYSNGRLGFIDHLDKGRRVGPYLEFYDTPQNTLHIRARFDSLKISERPTDYIEYDTQGNVISRKTDKD